MAMPDVGVGIDVGGGIDASLDASGADARDAFAFDAPTQPCDLTAPFGAPVQVRGLESPSQDYGATLSSDERTVYFVSTRAGGREDIYRASRLAIDAAFQSIAPVPALNSPSYEYEPSLSEDGLTMVWSSRRDGADLTDDLFIAAITGSTFGSVTRINDVEVGGENYPFLVNDDLYFAGGAGTLDLWMSSRSGAGWTAPSLLSELDLTADNESGPVVSIDESTIYFASQRAPNLGCADIWVSHRTPPATAWGTPEPVAGVNSAGCETPQWISADGCRLYIDHRGTDAFDDLDVFVAVRPPAP
jgi:hypothetical protein